MSEDITREQQKHPTPDIGPISWWSWRPGIQPRNALVIGGLITVVALLLAGIGLVTLVLGSLDSFTPPVQVTGIVAAHTVNKLDGQPHLIVRLHTTGFPEVATPAVPYLVFHSIQDGESILLDYSPRLHVLFALESAGRRYILPGGSIMLDLIGSISLLLIGGILLPYPALLLRWGWQDLFASTESAKRSTLIGKVVSLRASLPTRKGRSGLVPHAARPWYGVAIHTPGVAGEQQVTTFALNQERYRSLHEGDTVKIIYSPHVHYVFTLEQVHE